MYLSNLKGKHDLPKVHYGDMNDVTEFIKVSYVTTFSVAKQYINLNTAGTE